MSIKSPVSNEMFAGRVSAHGQITDLTEGFSSNLGSEFLAEQKPFTIIVVPKADVTAGVITPAGTATGLMVSCKMYKDDDFSLYPVYFHEETPAAIIEIGVNAIDLTTYDVYWGSSQIITPAV